jgi:hypothetical protein
MKAFIFFVLLLAYITAPIMIAPPPLIPNTICRDFSTSFTQFGSRCVLGMHFNSPATVRLYVFDINCNLIGENLTIPVSPSSDFTSQLPYVIVMEELKTMAPPNFWYAGMKFGGNTEECWVAEDEQYACAQVFQC